MEEKNPETMTYSEAIAELEQIVKLMQSENCSIDNLSALTSRSLKLLNACRAKLTATDEEVKKILAAVDQQ